MTPSFDETKATQIAAELLDLRGGRMHYLKLIKLMYLIEREALLRWGFPLTNDELYSMENGCVMSHTLNLITEEQWPESYWRQFISGPLGDFEIQLNQKPELDEVSEAERELVHEVFRSYGNWNRWNLAKLTHNLPEYRETPRGQRQPIDYQDILLGAKKSEDDVREILNDLEEVALLEYTLSSS
jgi:uncharacterized phage-associated protein